MTDEKKSVVRVEGHAELARDVQKTMNVAGLEEVPMSMIPLPFYKLVQPGSTNIGTQEGEDAPAGSILMKDTGEAVSVLRIALLRAKRQSQQITDDYGATKVRVSMGLLGINLDGFSPFIMNVPISSFSAFGQLMKQIKDRKASRAWEYPITITSGKREETKTIGGRPQKVKYWVLSFQLEKEPMENETLELLDGAYKEFASSLDRQNEQDDHHPASGTVVDAAPVDGGEGPPF